MPIEACFDEALRSDDRVAELRRLAQRMLEEGSALDAVLSRFERARQELRTAARADDEDAVMDAMDFVTGWCSPHMKL